MQKDLDVFGDIMKRVEATYKNGLPLHLSSPKDSVFSIVSSKDFIASKYKNLVSNRVVVIVDKDYKAEKTFTREVLQNFAPVGTIVQPHGKLYFILIQYLILNKLFLEFYFAFH